ncbi:hypothetical protein [Streptomyces althioticus]|uniref:hypothetical protein n=1 Tax=Streptomyces althioticus TaxID=83380 RepID=UPI0036C89AD7
MASTEARRGGLPESVDDIRGRYERPGSGAVRPARGTGARKHHREGLLTPTGPLRADGGRPHNVTAKA